MCFSLFFLPNPSQALVALVLTANANAQHAPREEIWENKTPDEFTGDDRRRDNLDGIVFNTIINTVPRSLQSKLRGCKTACEAWQKIKELSEGSSMATPVHQKFLIMVVSFAINFLEKRTLDM